MGALYKHMGKINCPVDDCAYSTDSNRGLAIHASSQHPNLDYDFTNRKEYECPQCKEIFKDYSSRRESKNSKNNFCSKDCKDLFEAKDGLDTECAECGSNVHISPSHIDEVDGYKQKNYFCDKECESSFRSRTRNGKDNPHWKGGKVRLYCDECGDQFMVKQSEEDSSKYCSRECVYNAQSKDKETYNCVNCGDKVMKMAHDVRNGNTTCSKECHSEYMSSIRRGEDNPQWQGGRFEYYGPNWPEQRKAALNRDDHSCDECDMTQDEHYQNYDEDLHVHHKVPRRQIIDEDEPTLEQFELANSLDNLVTVCKSCHRKLESDTENGT